ncbi:ABC transporter permease [Paracidobacterium acidisoli]|uniref:ABC transporter permease n=1 Tax=Paracidobacterium acidisoli TaxID=2303751 RepID=A0A372IQB1_9BACT|nr:ABC transporter permease [Paracidobacterium acidisoli]MBT9331267.1 ABC transporter permease [Paracidobacterium acidisoli]
MAWFRSLFPRRRMYDDLSEEIRQHLEEKIESLMADGLSREDAGHQARREFGNAMLMEERSREVWLRPWIESLCADLRFAWRQAVKSPRFALAAVATLAIGIGAQTAVYSVIHAVLIDPYPYRGAMRMVHFHLYDKNPFPFDMALDGQQFAEFRRSPVLDGVIAEDKWSMTLTGEELPVQIQADRTSSNAFQFFGVPALAGREFSPSDPQTVAVLSYRFWRSHFAGRMDVIGKRVQLNHQDYTILGVLPQRFAWGGSDVYIPFAYSADPQRIASVYARVRAGVSDQAAEQALQPMLDRFARETPGNFPQNFRVHLVHIHELATGRFRGVLTILFLSVSFLLALACVNIAILLLARGEARQTEMALRKALGAGRGRIIAQLLTESLLLSIAGEGCGVLLALAGVRLLRQFIPASLFPSEAVIRINLSVLFFSVGVSMLTGIVCGVWPALRAARSDLRQAADAGSHKLAGRRGLQKSHTALLAAQLTMTVLLLACSGATVRRLSQLVHADLGYDPHQLVSTNLTLSEGDHHGWSDRVHFYEQIRKMAAADPGVISAAIAENNLPPSIIDSAPISIPALNAGSNAASKFAADHVVPQRVSPEFFATLRIPLLRGRVWNTPEMAHAAHLALINQAMQRRYWPGSDPLGQSFVLNHGVASGNAWVLVAPGNNERYQIIGVVGDTPNQGLDEQTAPAVYLPYTMITYDWFNLMLRIRGNAPELLHTLREQVHGLDAGQSVGDLVTAEDMLNDDTLGRERFIAGLFTAFALVGLVFALSGLYCVQSYLVAQRTREFGVRMALGAGRLHIAALVTKTSALAVAAGTGLGLLLNLLCSRTFADWTSGNSRDPQMLGIILAVLLVAAVLVSAIPVLFAAAIDPVTALRAE